MPDVMATDNASAGTSAPAASAPSAPAPASVPESGATPTSGLDTATTPTPEGPIPFDRHKAILENARQEYEQKYGWIGDRQREQIENMERWYSQMDADPVAFYDWLGSRLQAMPEYAPRLQPRGQRPAGPPQGVEGLIPDGQMPDGTPVFTAANVQKYVDSLLSQKLEPIQQTFAQQQIEQQTMQQVHAELADARTNWHAFTELEPAIKKIMQRDGRATLHSAYQRAYKDWLPTYEQKIRSQQVSDLAKKANASTPSPTGGPATPKEREQMPWEDVLRQKLGERR